jgi:hypothetical protein
VVVSRTSQSVDMGSVLYPAGPEEVESTRAASLLGATVLSQCRWMDSANGQVAQVQNQEHNGRYFCNGCSNAWGFRGTDYHCTHFKHG